ncbi:MAG TPA: hypothetical protein VHZ26_01680 [Caulobacteraceae bacterium]|jgi:hypothetical protein|nr:hypothetical protein [Caulobacteraceae bacterium]
MKLLATMLALALACASAARAQAPDMSCRNGSFPKTEKSIALAKVAGADRLYFLNDADGCPNGTPACRQRAYVVAGNELLTGRGAGPYVCAFFPNRVGGSAGWIERARLVPVPVPASPPLGAWAGHWANGDDTIDLTVKAGALVADGSAWWPSANPSPAQFPGGPNVGDLGGTARPSGAKVVFTDNDPSGCTATLTLVGTLLVVADNRNCGGMNVSFSGVYQRK